MAGKHDSVLSSSCPPSLPTQRPRLYSTLHVDDTYRSRLVSISAGEVAVEEDEELLHHVPAALPIGVDVTRRHPGRLHLVHDLL